MKTRKALKKKTLSFPCLSVKQGKDTLVVFSAPADELFRIVSINRRESDKERGYQRVLAPSRVSSISHYVAAGNPIPTSILVSFDDTKLSGDGNMIMIPNRPNAGWVIDGQHRLAGVHESKQNIDLAVVGFVNLPVERQIQQFVKINKEAKNVPTSLYLDLLKHIPQKSEADQAKERAVDLAKTLRKDEESPFFGKITIESSPKPGELSLANFVRKVAPLVKVKGRFHLYSMTEQIRILNNYYKAFSHVFPEVYAPSEGVSILFKTLGFGALINALTTVFELTFKTCHGFKVEHVAQTLRKIDDFQFEDWNQKGTGSEAENSAGDDLRTKLIQRFQEVTGEEGTLAL